MTRNLFLFACVCLAWGMTWVPIKAALVFTTPVLLGATRLVTAGVLMLLVAGAAGLATLRALDARERRTLVVSSFLINTVCYALLLWGLSHAPSGLAAIVNLSLIPVFSGLFGWLHGQERITTRRVLAVALGIAGLGLLYSGQAAAADAQGAPGLAAIALSAASYCWGAVLTRPLLERASAHAVAGSQMLIGSTVMLPLAIVVDRPTSAQALALLQWPALGALAYLVFVGSFVGFIFYLRLLRAWGPFRAGFYAFVSPVIAVLAGVAWLGEPFGWVEAGGATVMFAATALAVKGSGLRPNAASGPDPAKSAGS